MKQKYSLFKKMAVALSLSPLLATGLYAQQENELLPPEIGAPTEYKGTSFVANWQKLDGKVSYMLDVYTLDKKNPVTANEDFSQINSKDGKIDLTQPNYPEGWQVLVSNAGNKDVQMVGNKKCVLLDGHEDYILSPLVNGAITSFTMDLDYVNATGEVTEENSSVFFIYLFDASGNYITGGGLSASILKEYNHLEVFYDLFQRHIDNVGAIMIGVDKKSNGQNGDVVVKNLELTYAPKVAHLDNVPTPEHQFLVENTDPENVYFYRVSASADGIRFTPYSKTQKVDLLMTPQEAVVDEGDNYYTASWQEVPRADKYVLWNNRITLVESDGAFTALSDQFDKVKEGTMEAPQSVNGLDGLTELNGWTGNLFLTANGMIGADNGSFRPRPNPGFLQTPELDLSGNGGKYTVHIKAYGKPGDYLSVYRVGYVVDGQLNIHATQEFPESGCIDEEWEMNDGVKGMRLSIEPRKMGRFFIDDISITQNRKKGDIIKMDVAEKAIMEAGDKSHTFEGLDNNQLYGFEMCAVHYDENEMEIVSPMSKMQVIDLSTVTGIEAAQNSSADVQFSLEQGQLKLNLAKAAPIAVYGANGKLAARLDGKVGENTLTLSGNVYVVKVGSSTFKVILK